MITQFQGRYRFLSNFWMSTVQYEGMNYCSVEHAYQAAKTLDPAEREKIRWCLTPALAKRFGRGVTLRADWESVKIPVMTDLVRQKFKPKIIGEWLQATGNEVLVEGNSWGDTFWGRCRGVGENNLGIILMKVREERKTELYQPAK